MPARLVLLAALALLVAGVPASSPGAAASSPPAPFACGERVSTPAGTWLVRPAPDFPTGGPRLVSAAVQPQQPTSGLATDGLSVLGTDDGCTWREVWRLPSRPGAGAPYSSATDRVLEVAFHPRDPALAWAVVAVGQDVADDVRVANLGPDLFYGPARDEKRDGTQTVVVRSTDGGATWTPGPVLPGAPGRLAPAPSDPRVLYLPTMPGLQVSRDGGRSWTLQPPAVTAPEPAPGRPPLDAVVAPDVVRVAVDPADPDALLGHSTTVVRRSTDGGRLWASVGLPPAWTYGAFPDERSGAEQRVLVATHPSSTERADRLWFRQRDGAYAEVPVVGEPLPGVPFRAVWHRERDEVVVATWDRGSGSRFEETLLRVRTDGSWEDVNDLGLTDVLQLQGDRFDRLHLHTDSELVVLEPEVVPDDAGVPEIELDPFSYVEPPPPDPAELEAPGELLVAPGASAPLPVALDLPARPSPLDVYFMLDASGSFAPDVQEIADGLAGVVRALGAAGVDVHVGVGEIGTAEGTRYRRLVDVVRPGTALRRGFERYASGGGSESHLVALGQAATGSGVAGTDGPAVPPGLDPTWRRGTLRTMVVVTDVGYMDEDDPEAPSRAELHAALRADGVRVVGLEVARDVGEDGVPGSAAAADAADRAGTTVPSPARQDLEELAAATGSFAPDDGVDCRADGTVEVPAGAPLVCTSPEGFRAVRPFVLADVVLRLLASQEDPAVVRLRATGDVAVGPADGASWRRAVDLRDDVRLDLPGTATCTREQAGAAFPVLLEAVVGGRAVAERTVVVRCGEPASPVAGPPAGPAPALPPAPAAAPGGAPVAGAPPLPLPPPAPVVVPGAAAAGSPAGSAAGSAAGSPAAATGGAPGAAAAPGTRGTLAGARVAEARLPVPPSELLFAAVLLTGAAARRWWAVQRPGTSLATPSFASTSLATTSLAASRPRRTP